MSAIASSERDGQTLIDSFFAAVLLRQLDQCQTILAALETLATAAPVWRAWCRYLRGVLAFEIDHDWAAAEANFIAVLQSEPDVTLRLRAQHALGRAYEEQARWQEAIVTYGEVATLATKLQQDVDKAKAWKHMAICYRVGFVQSDFGNDVLPLAIDHCEAALRLLEPLLTANAPTEVRWLAGSLWNELGALAVACGQWQRAIACYQRDQAICEQLADRYGMAISALNLGEVYQKLGQAYWPKARQAYQDALVTLREFESHLLVADTLANLGALYQEMGDQEQALQAYCAAIQVIETVRTGITSEPARAGFFATIADIYAHAVLLCVALGRTTQAFELAERARARTLLDLLAASRLDLPETATVEPLTLTEVQRVLPDDALLLAYFTTGLEEIRLGKAARRSNFHRHRFPPSKTLLFVVSHDALHLFEIQLRPNDLAPETMAPAVDSQFLQPQLRRMIYDKLLAPAETLLKGKRRLYVAPHGSLHAAPFHALLAPDGAPLVRLGGPALVYGFSATMFFQPRPIRSEQAVRSCLAVGYNGGVGATLAFAEAEALHVAHLTAGDALLAPTSLTPLNAQASNYRLLHFSCHGEFNAAAPLDSRLQVGPATSLSAHEILQRLRLHCDLLVLSACESGLSHVQRGDEPFGLTRAFLHAGAAAVVATLWRVDELATLLLMDYFYQTLMNVTDDVTDYAKALAQSQHYLRTLTLAQARDRLRDLQAAEWFAPGVKLSAPNREDGGATSLLTGNDPNATIFADPYYWAPFILIGQPEGLR